MRLLLFLLVFGGFGGTVIGQEHPDFGRPEMITLAFSPKDRCHKAQIDFQRTGADTGCIWFMLSSDSLPYKILFSQFDSILLTAADGAKLCLNGRIRDSIWEDRRPRAKIRNGYLNVLWLGAGEIAFLKQNPIRQIVFMGGQDSMPLNLARRSGEAIRRRVNDSW